jgi:hypothetical protein
MQAPGETRGSANQLISRRHQGVFLLAPTAAAEAHDSLVAVRLLPRLLPCEGCSSFSVKLGQIEIPFSASEIFLRFKHRSACRVSARTARSNSNIPGTPQKRRPDLPHTGFRDRESVRRRA